MGVRLEAVTFEVVDVPAVAGFWSELLRREVLGDSGGALLPGADAQIGLRFVTSDAAPAGPHRLHLHLTSTSREDQHRTVETALHLGGRHLDVGQERDAEYVVMVDPGGNPLCVIEPDNGFLAGTGHLGEVACDGTRDLGLFWRDALGWPLVWDENEETAIQSPLGGTKISWGGPPVEPRQGPSRQRLDCVTTDVRGEAERLLSLGATHRADLSDGAWLADPDGNDFSLRHGDA